MLKLITMHIFLATNGCKDHFSITAKCKGRKTIIDTMSGEVTLTVKRIHLTFEELVRVMGTMDVRSVSTYAESGRYDVEFGREKTESMGLP